MVDTSFGHSLGLNHHTVTIYYSWDIYRPSHNSHKTQYYHKREREREGEGLLGWDTLDGGMHFDTFLTEAERSEKMGRCTQHARHTMRQPILAHTRTKKERAKDREITWFEYMGHLIYYQWEREMDTNRELRWSVIRDVSHYVCTEMMVIAGSS